MILYISGEYEPNPYYMNSSQPSVILEEVKNLVSHSCSGNAESGSAFTSFHKGLVKLYFEARNVEIDYQLQNVKVEILVGANQYTTVSFECQDLERFLRSCVRADKRSLLYYQNVLSYYSTSKVA